MTDNEIIKAYEGLTPRQQLNLFRNLYYNDGYATERGVIANAINDILSEHASQKAKIEKLQGNMKFVRGTVARLLETSDKQQATIEKLKEAYAVYEETTGLKQVREDAYRKFAERLKRKSRRISEYDEGGWYMDIRAVKIEDIDNLVKEMTEETP